MWGGSDQGLSSLSTEELTNQEEISGDDGHPGSKQHSSGRSPFPGGEDVGLQKEYPPREPAWGRSTRTLLDIEGPLCRCNL